MQEQTGTSSMASCSADYMRMNMDTKSVLEVEEKQPPRKQQRSKRVIAFVVFLGAVVVTVVILQFCINRSEGDKKADTGTSNDSKATSAPPCSGDCTITLVESIPENLEFPSGSVRHPTIYEGWMRLLKTASKSIDISSFYWTLLAQDTNTTDPSTKEGENVFESLIAAGKRGVKIRIVQSAGGHTQTKDTAILEEEASAEVRSINVTRLVGSGILHTKMWLVDGKHFYVGSANQDWRALTQVQELGLMSYNCSCMATDMSKIFEVYWDLAKPNSKIPDPWPKKYETNINADTPAQMTINGSNTAAVYLASSPPQFCPPGRTDDLSAILRVINSARKFVYISVMDYFPTTLYMYPRTYWPVIDDALRRAAFDRKVKVRLMASMWNHTRPDLVLYLQSLASLDKANDASVQTRLYKVPPYSIEIPFSRVNHNKFMVTETTAYVGTSNWSADYFLYTGGISYVINETETGDTVRAQLQAVFERNWNSTFTTPVYCQTSAAL